MELSFIIGFIIYTIVICAFFLKNPFDWINENNGGAAIFLAIFGGFLILLMLFFYTRRNNLFKNESKQGTLSFFGKVITSIFSLFFIIILCYVIFNFTANYSEWSNSTNNITILNR